MKMGVKSAIISIILATMGMPKVWADENVTTYIIKVQKERESTRFTLTEWLRIKERMKMMDVWLAMFSEPEKQKFAPELMLAYGGSGGTFTETISGVKSSGGMEGTMAGAQFWFTNLVTSTMKVKTLNIDLGLEAAGTSQSSTDSTHKIPTGKLAQLSNAAMTFRLFGANIQDSGLFLRAGKYQKTFNFVVPSQEVNGLMAGGSLTIYLLNFLGIDGNYTAFGDNQSLTSADHQGTYYDYSVFLEGGVLRFGGGRQSESWKFKETKTLTEVKTDYTAGYIYVKLLF